MPCRLSTSAAHSKFRPWTKPPLVQRNPGVRVAHVVEGRRYPDGDVGHDNVRPDVRRCREGGQGSAIRLNIRVRGQLNSRGSRGTRGQCAPFDSRGAVGVIRMTVGGPEQVPRTGPDTLNRAGSAGVVGRPALATGGRTRPRLHPHGHRHRHKWQEFQYAHLRPSANLRRRAVKIECRKRRREGGVPVVSRHPPAASRVAGRARLECAKSVDCGEQVGYNIRHSPGSMRVVSLPSAEGAILRIDRPDVSIHNTRRSVKVHAPVCREHREAPNSRSSRDLKYVT
jgi:hypothetical protein